ncbi:5-formyltetrahydrofolate cyclo-ligase [Devosia sp. RR2S18]|uniref:5-formyltetrahydrofolate cyclo-ligase n=1 Tax=Devosia rhizosphaerae TaxID=3049774 RepID=UPI0025414AD1|nr:5-formyltetrahydrofolate cyclo-ligase [Devosia sp. RR2S18]WIJ26052.1 5-formyltetrahydrofolate cyclo-ligase [Devosia sp. RR2S18]
MADDTIEQTKAELRAKAHAIRASLSADLRAEAADAVALHFFASFPPAPDCVVAAYWSIRDEVDTNALLLRLMDAGTTVVLPAVTSPDGPLDFRVWEPGEALYEAGFGTLAPAPSAPRADPDCVLMPLLGFDAQGTRLGYGGGYYDRTIADLDQKPTLVGIAFSAQEFSSIPRQDHDVPLDAVITETGVHQFGGAA